MYVTNPMQTSVEPFSRLQFRFLISISSFLVIHVLFVPYIFWGLVLSFNIFGQVIENKFFQSMHLPLSFGTLAAFGYIGYYLYLGDFPVAVPYSLILLLMTMHANATYTANPEHTLMHFLLSQSIGWGLQVVVGHGFFEGKKPALTDSLFDSIIMAPLFTFYEIIFALGFRAELKKALDAKIDAKSAKLFQNEKQR